MELSKVQQDTIAFIESFSEKKKRPPTYRDIAVEFGISTMAAFDRIKTLIKYGVVTKDDKLSRSFRVVKHG